MNDKTYLAILIPAGSIVLLLSINFFVNNESQDAVTSSELSVMHEKLAIASRASSYLEGYQQALHDADSLKLLEWEDYDQSITIERLMQHRERLENLKGEN